MQVHYTTLDAGELVIGCELLKLGTNVILNLSKLGSSTSISSARQVCLNNPSPNQPNSGGSVVWLEDLASGRRRWKRLCTETFTSVVLFPHHVLLLKQAR